MLCPELQEVLTNPTVKKVQFLVKWLFPGIKACQNITFTQAYMVKRIAFSEVKRISISAYTRYGKSQIVAIAVALYILLNENKKVKFIGPTSDQAEIIKNYMSELILGSRNNILLNLAEIYTTREQKLKSEASSKRMTFKNGCEYRVITAHGKGFAGMGHGGDLIIMDEAAMISRESYAKITRMLGDDPEESVLVELFNPWDRDTKAFDHSISLKFERITINWRVGVKEGRTTEEYIKEMKDDVTPLEFCVLYESRFPDEAEDALHILSAIEQAEKREYNFLDEYTDLLKKSRKKSLNESQTKEIKEEMSRYKFIISCDPADQGLDFTAIKWGIIKDNTFYELYGIYSEPKSEPMEIVGRLIKIAKDFVPNPKTDQLEFNIDKIGIGRGPECTLRERKNELGWKNCKVKGCHYGESAINDVEFADKKAENNFRLREIFSMDKISLKKITKNKDYPKLKTELLSIKWKLTSRSKKKIEDPEKSPDFSDALVYFVWKDNKTLKYSFI